MCLGLLHSISYLFVFKILFFFLSETHLWMSCSQSSMYPTMTMDLLHWVVVQPPLTLLIGWHLNKIQKKNISAHEQREIPTVKQPAQPYNPRQRACEHIPLAFLKKESECKVLDSHQPAMILVPSWELFIITVLTYVYTNTFTGKQSLQFLLQWRKLRTQHEIISLSLESDSRRFYTVQSFR